MNIEGIIKRAELYYESTDKNLSTLTTAFIAGAEWMLGVERQINKNDCIGVVMACAYLINIDGVQTMVLADTYKEAEEKAEAKCLNSYKFSFSTEFAVLH